MKLVPDKVASYNERMKALGTLVTGISLILLTYGVFRPAIDAGGNPKAASPAWLIVGVVGICCQQYILTLIKKEAKDDSA